MRGLLIRSPHIERILSGEKTWELRSRRTSVRETIGLIRSGSGLVVGTCDLVGCEGPLTRPQLRRNARRHRAPVAAIRDLGYREVFAWVLASAHPLDPPIAYRHPPGAVIWVDLDRSLDRAERRRLAVAIAAVDRASSGSRE